LSGSSNFQVNGTRFLIATNASKLDEISVFVFYGSQNYYRTLKISSAVEYRNIFLVDLASYTVVKIRFTLTDITGSFLDSLFSVQRQIGSSLFPITEDYWDAASKVVTYLTQNEKYQIYVNNGDETRLIGNIVADTAEEKELTITSISIYNATNFMNQIFYSLVNGSNYIRLIYNDTTNRTTNVSLNIYYSNGTLAYFSYDTSGNPSVIITYAGAQFQNITYTAEMTAYSLDYGYVRYSKTFGILMPVAQQGIPSSYYAFGAFGFLMAMVLIFGAVHAKIGALLTGILAVAFWGFHWIDSYMSFSVVSLCVILGVLSLMSGKERV
jgi:hypothetical protein